jgi:hypothetical protein
MREIFLWMDLPDKLEADASPGGADGALPLGIGGAIFSLGNMLEVNIDEISLHIYGDFS